MYEMITDIFVILHCVSKRHWCSTL